MSYEDVSIDCGLEYGVTGVASQADGESWQMKLETELYSSVVSNEGRLMSGRENIIRRPAS